MGVRDLLFVGLILGGAAALGASLYPPRLDDQSKSSNPGPISDKSLVEVVRKVDEDFQERWSQEGLSPSRRASELLVIRRLALSLTGSIPSLEEIRQIQATPVESARAVYLERLLGDRRFSDYFAERLARSYVGTEGGPFLFFRRHRFVSWLSDEIAENTPYDVIVRELISAKGIWTDKPATNFITVTYDSEKKAFDAERLAGRVSRAFLGARIDCAQCHDHPFAPWKQKDFLGLAAFFGQTQKSLTGLCEMPVEFTPTDRKTNTPVKVAPQVPFSPELLPPEAHGDRRERLAQWVTHPGNRAFPRAIVNRVWALMFGRPLVEPIDDLSAADEIPESLDVIADDFATHGYNLRRLIRIIAATEVFQCESASDTTPTENQEKAWAIFPLTRLRPEQVVGSVLQSARLETIDTNSHIFVRLGKYFGESKFIERFGDSGEDEFNTRGGTIPQRLLMMNGEIVRERTKPDLFNAGSRVGWFAPTDEAAVEVAYLTLLSRKPTAEESRHFIAKLKGTKGDARGERMSDLFWTLVNATEFSWNH